MADYISRADALAVIRHCKDQEKAIRELPGVTAVTAKEPGRWIEYSQYMSCSVCGECWYYGDNDCDRFDFCPNCGAAMTGGNEE